MGLKVRYTVRMLCFPCAALVVAATVQAQSPTPEVMKELRRIEAAALRGAADSIRIEYTAKGQERPSDPMPRVYLAWLTLPSDDSWNQLKAVATIYPDNPWVHYGMGRIYTKWKMRDQAKAEVELTLKRDPKFYPGITVLGDLALSQDDGAQAEAQYRRALALEDDPLARAGLGLALLKQGKKAEAVEALKASARAFPEQPAVLASLIPLLLEAKDPAVLEAAQVAAELRPKDREARLTIATLRFDAGDKAGAAKDYDRLIALGNPDPAVVERLASLYRELGSSADEERVVGIVAASQPSNPEPCLRLYELRLAKQDLPGAEAALTEALSRDPKLKAPRLALAKLKAETDQGYQALEQYRLVRELDPQDAEAKEQLAKLGADFKLPKRPLRGSVNGVYWSVTASLDKLFAERRAARPGLAGKVKLRLQVGPKGTVTSIEVVEDTLKDAILLGHVYFSLKDAQYQEKKVEPVIEFELGGKKK